MSDPDERRPVQLLAVPVAGGQAVVVYRNDMIRELQLIELGQGLDGVGPSDLDPVAKDLRAELVWLRDEFSGHFRLAEPDGSDGSDPSGASATSATSGDAGDSAGPDGSADGEAVFDWIADLRPDAANRIKRVVDHFEELNWFSSHGQLLTVGASPVVMELIRWLRDEAYGQLIDGRPPRPFAYRTSRVG